jgi:hypothetical protein
MFKEKEEIVLRTLFIRVDNRWKKRKTEIEANENKKIKTSMTTFGQTLYPCSII